MRNWHKIKKKKSSISINLTIRGITSRGFTYPRLNQPEKKTKNFFNVLIKQNKTKLAASLRLQNETVSSAAFIIMSDANLHVSNTCMFTQESILYIY